MSRDVVVALLGSLAGLASLLLWLGLRPWHSPPESPPDTVAEMVAQDDLSWPPAEEDGDLPAAPGAPAGWRLRSIWHNIRRRAPRDQSWLTRQLYRAGLPLTRHELALLVGAGTALALLLGWVLAGDVRWGVAAVLALALGAAAMVRRLQRKRAMLFDEQLLDVLELLLTSRKAGFSLAQSLVMVARQMAPPAGMEFDIVRREIQFGRDSTQALRHLHERVANDDLKLLIDALVLQNATGGDLIPVLEMLVATVRQRMQLRREVRALTAQGRLSSYVLGLLPALVGIALYFLDPIDMSFFWTNVLGAALLMVTLMSVAIGSTLIRRIVDVRL